MIQFYKDSLDGACVLPMEQLVFFAQRVNTTLDNLSKGKFLH